MVEETITDSLGNSLTLRYDDVNDQVSIRNTGMDGEFRLIYLNPAMLVPDNVITVVDVDGPEEWEGFTDDLGRGQMKLFWDTHKIDKETRGL
jgi:hypothetical protein